MISPLVSVIIPTYNRADTVQRSIDSALEQSHRPMEVIVVDDGSTDATIEVLEGYGDRIRFITQKNAGPSAARNAGVGLARGEFIAFLDSDDTWKPSKIARQVGVMLGGGRMVPCCMCNAELINDDGPGKTTFGVSGVMSGLQEGFWANPAPIIATRFILFNQVALLRRDAFDKVGGFNPEMRLLEDHDLAFRLSLLGPWAFVAEPLVEKYNDTRGIGVIAMQDPLVHSRAWRNVLECFLEYLKAAPGADPQVGHLVRRALADVKCEIHSVEMLLNGGRFGRAAARIRMFSASKRHALRRRMPGWPRVQALASLPCDHDGGCLSSESLTMPLSPNSKINP